MGFIPPPAVVLTPSDNTRNTVSPPAGVNIPLNLNTSSTGPNTFFTGTAASLSGAYGWVINKQDKTAAFAHTVDFQVGGVGVWSMGTDFNTNNSLNGGTGGSYFALLNYAANGGVAADVFAVSTADADTVSTGVKACKFAFVGDGTGTPATNTFLVLFSTGGAVDLGGAQINIKSAIARDHLSLVQSATGSHRAAINYNGKWITGPDLAGALDDGFYWRDAANSKNRMWLQNTSAINFNVGFNTTAPIAGVHYATSTDVTLQDTAQSTFAMGASTLQNRAWNVTTIIGASQTTNTMWFMGTLGTGSTQAAPVTTSTFTKAHGITCDQTTMSFVTAPSGTNQTILPAIAVTNNGSVAQLGFLGATPVAQISGSTDVLAGLVTQGLRAASSNPPLNLGTGAVTAGAISGTSITVPGAGGSSEKFGASAAAAGTQATAVGNQASASGLDSTAVGYLSVASASDSTALGWQANATGVGSLRVGGGGGFASATAAIAIGQGGAGATAQGAIAIGYGASSNIAQTLVLGGSLATTLLTDGYFGNGITATSPSAFTFHSSGGSGTDITGANLTLAGGNGTGNSGGGDIIFQSTRSGQGSATTLRSLEELLRLSNAGVMTHTLHTSTSDRSAFDLTPTWATSTDASRKARTVFNIWDTAAREAMRLEASGSAAMIGFLGASAIARPSSYTLAGSATRTFPTDPSSGYTGIDNLQAGTPYAQVSDLNTLRAVVSSLEGVVRQLTIDLASTSGYGLLVAS
jgi:hypothetical protein